MATIIPTLNLAITKSTFNWLSKKFIKYQIKISKIKEKILTSSEGFKFIEEYKKQLSDLSGQTIIYEANWYNHSDLCSKHLLEQTNNKLFEIQYYWKLSNIANLLSGKNIKLYWKMQKYLIKLLSIGQLLKLNNSNEENN